MFTNAAARCEGVPGISNMSIAGPELSSAPNSNTRNCAPTLAAPALAVTFFLSFMGNWQEFALSWLFLSNPGDYTLAMTLYNMTGQYATSIPWNRFSAMAIIVAAPVAVIYVALQKQIVGGLTLGGVKG